MARKVILSRKGFDKTTGGKASPIMKDNLVSLPIPRADSGDFYKNLNISSTESYLKVMKELGIKLFSEAHLDPDLQRSILKDRPAEWRGLFGQSGTSQVRLKKNSVGKGDIFLFFGWFRNTQNNNGQWEYIRKALNIHAIFGYLEVDEVFDIKAGDEVPSWSEYHPHIRDKKEYGKQQNSVYMATKSFTADKGKPGWGCFNFNERLILTKSKSKIRTLWELPTCFQGEQDNFVHAIETWNELPNGRVEMKTKGMGDLSVAIPT
ncbi:hypothetical protein [Sporosarcina cyprini]|uniref:Nmad3 family putative nucleotide modification protein n=1 Tax=Sporosarcina cyprini TaxID=2910523 RepID=UPI001EDDF6F4|nr:hypothetical protein [Sporosarcina cyprini]MCG3086381.1 hypothetical protein [Sporosarcina cyprini]